MKTFIGILCALMFCFSAFAGGAPWMGVNLESARDWEANNMFADAMKQSRPWGSAAAPWDQAAAVDSNGWPTGDAGVVVKSLAIYNDIGGTYHLSFTGQANVAGVACLVTIQNKVYDAASNMTTCDVVVDPTNQGISLAFTGTTGGVQNVKMMRPGYTSETFTTPFINLLQPFSCLRSVWLSQVISSPVVNWSDRTLPSYATMNHRVGVGNTNSLFYGCAWEYIIQLSNETNKDLWVNIPDQATDDYVLQLASLLKNSANPNLHIYVEWSNEVWNGQYAETGRNQAAANAEVAAGNSPLNFDGETNPGYLAWRRVGKRTKEVSDIFRSVFGDADMMTRVRPVLCMQCGYTMTIRQPIEFLNSYYGPPSNYLYAIACAPYFGIPNAWSTRTDLTVDDIIGALPASLSATMAAAKDFSTFAHWYNVKFMTYEGGPSITGVNSLTAKIQSATDPRMQAITVSFCDQFNQIGGDWLNYYTSVSYNGQYGTFGLTDNDNNLNTPKYQGILQALAAPRAAVTAGTAVPGTISAGSFDLQSGFVAPGPATVQLNGNWFEYLIRVPSNGTYTLTCSVAANAAAQMQALVDTAPITTWNIASTGGLSTYATLPQVNMQLSAGLNVIRMTGVSGNFNLQSIIIGAMPSIVTSVNSMSVGKGASAAFNCHLSRAPSVNVTVNAAWLSGDADLSVSGGASMFFTPTNWNVDQTITVADSASADAVYGSAIIRCSAPGYANVDVTASEVNMTPLAFTSLPTVSPSTVVAGTAAMFSAAASGNGVVLSWNFGDGSASVSGNSVSHTYVAAGTMTVTCTAADAFNQQISATLNVVIQAAPVVTPPQPPQPPAPPQPPVSSNPPSGPSNNPGNPSGDPSSGPASNGPQTIPMTVSKLLCKLNLATSGKDSASCSGVIPSLPDGFSPAGQTVTVDIGGASVDFTLDAKGHARNSQGSFTLKLKLSKSHSVIGGSAPFSCKLSNGNFASDWEASGINVSVDAKQVTMPMTVDVTLSGNDYSATVNGSYSCKAGKAAMFKN